MRNALWRAFITMGILLMAAPVFLLAGAALSGERAALWLLPLAAALALGFAVRQLPPKGRIAGAVGAAVASAGIALGLGTALGAGGWAYGMAAALAFASAAHLLLLSRLRTGEAPGVMWLVGMAVYGGARMATTLLALPLAQPPLRICAVLYFCYIIWALILDSLHEGMGGGRSPSRAMMIKNAAIGAVLALVLLFVIHLPQLAQALRWAVDVIRRGLGWLADIISSLLPEASPAGAGGGGLDMSALAMEAGEPALLWVILEKVLYVVAALLAAAIAVSLLYMILRGLWRGIRLLIARLRAYAGAVTEAYEDTVESLLDWGEVRRAVAQRRQKRSAQRQERTPWEQLTPRQRVRRSYQVYLTRHPDVPDARTARQTLGDSPLTRLYEDARYGSREITPEEAEKSRALQKQ